MARMANRFEFQKWVPAAACRELESQAEQELADYSLLHRLATYQVMRDDVWSKVAAEKADIWSAPPEMDSFRPRF